MLRVPFYTPDNELIGHIAWDGDELSTDSPNLKIKMSMPTLVPTEDGLTMLSPWTEPEEWLRSLPEYYTGGYVSVGELEEV